MTAQPETSRRARDRQVVGALLGVAVSGLVALGERLVFGGPQSTGFLIAESIGATGMPVAAVLGWRFAPRVGHGNPFWQVAWMAVAAVLLGCALGVAILAAGVIDGAWQVLASAPQLYVAGLLFFGWWILPFTAAGALAWWVLMRLALPPEPVR